MLLIEPVQYFTHTHSTNSEMQDFPIPKWTSKQKRNFLGIRLSSGKYNNRNQSESAFRPWNHQIWLHSSLY
jgi:hypothetical protein